MPIFERWSVIDDKGNETRCQTRDIAHQFMALNATSSTGFILTKIIENHTQQFLYGYPGGQPVPSTPTPSIPTNNLNITHIHHNPN